MHRHLPQRELRSHLIIMQPRGLPPNSAMFARPRRSRHFRSMCVAEGMMYGVVDEAVVAGSDGWTFQVDGQGVSQLGIDYRFSLQLGGGPLIVIETPFVLRRQRETHLFDPTDVTDVAHALPLLHQSCAPRGRVGRDCSPHVPRWAGRSSPNADVESWQVTFPDGRLFVGLILPTPVYKAYWGHRDRSR